MYIPPAFRETDFETLVGFMQAHSFATLVSIHQGIPVATHVPMVATVSETGLILSGHLAKANTQWQSFEAAEALAIFTGPHAYVDPALYEKAENVPTWNYIAVHAYGTPQALTLEKDCDRMDAMIDTMINAYDASYKAHWEGLSETYRQGMMSGIVGFEIAVTRLEGKYKLSQNRNVTDQHHVAQALLQSPDPAAVALGEAMQQNLPPSEA